MKHFTLEEKFQAIKRISDGSTVGIHKPELNDYKKSEENENG